MAKVLYVRHGQTLSNLARVVSGGVDDSPLTDEGKKQAELAAEGIGEAIDLLVVSPLRRTRQTADIIARHIGYNPAKIVVDKRLAEYDAGGAQGQPIEGMIAAKLLAFPGVEDPDHFAMRITSALKELTQESGTVLIVGHGIALRMLDCLKAGNDPKTFYDMPRYQNASVIELDLGWLLGSNET